MLQFLANQATYWLSNEPLSNDEENNSSSSSTSSRDSSSSSENITTERLVQPSAEPVDESSSITINDNDNKETSYSTFTPKADDENRNQTEDVKTHHNDSDEKDEETTCCCCCDCWREYRFVVIVVVSLLICLAAPLYLLIRHAHFEFDYHKECVICFEDKQEFKVIFNQTSGECDLFVENATYDSNDIVLDPNFCGAPHCQNLELLPGLRLVPYWAVVLTAIFSIVLSTGVNVIKYNCYLPIKRKTVRCIWGDETIEENPMIRLAEYEGAIFEDAKSLPKKEKDIVETQMERLRQLLILLKTIGLTDQYLFLLLSLYAIFHYSFSIHEVTTNPTFAHLDGWHKYQTIYGLFLNSGSIEVLWFWLSMGPLSLTVRSDFWDRASFMGILETRRIPGITEKLVSDASAFQQNLSDVVMMPLFQFDLNDSILPVIAIVLYGMIAVGITAPIFVTHIIPGIFLFIPYWSWILLALFLLVCFAEFVRVLTGKSSAWSWPSLVMLRLIGSFGVLLLFPILFNWTVLFYEGRTWSDVMTGEYRLRNTDCYFNALVNTIQIYNIGFVGLLFS